MTNAKSTKKSLLFSALSLMLCFAMLIGTTFAWFTDSVTSANNVIKSGNLDIELEYWNGEKWVDVKGKSDILTNTLWEPGVTEVAYLKVKNAGSLALKYQLGVNIASETAGVNAEGQSFLLSDYIMFGVVEGVNGETGAYANRDDAVADVTTAKKISAGYSKASSMLSGDEFYLALVVYMPTTVGNEANHNGVDVPEINLGISVVATQFSYEEDSFDETYDGAAYWLGGVDTEWYNTTDTSFEIANAEELAGFAALVNTGVDSFAGKTLTLTSDIDLANVEWVPIGNADADVFVGFKGTFDGQGHTISNLFIESDSWGKGLFGYMDSSANATVQNVTIDKVNITASDCAGAVVGYTTFGTFSNITVTNAKVTTTSNADGYAGALTGCGYNSDYVGCSVDNATITAGRSFAGGITGYQCNYNKSFADCSVTNSTITGYAAVGGVAGIVHAGGTAFSGCNVENVTLNKTRADGHPSIGVFTGCYTGSGATVFADNTADNVTLNGTHVAYVGYDALYGSSYEGVANTNINTTTTTATNIVNKLVEVKADSAALNGAIANGAEINLIGGQYTLSSLSGKEGVTITGAADGSTVISSGSTGFGSNFGKDSTFENLTFSGSTNGVRWSYAQGGTTVFENCTFKGDSTYGFHIDESNGATFIFNNCTFVGFNAFAGDLAMLEFNNCTFLSNGNYGNTNVWNVAYYNNCTWGEGAGFDVKSGTEIYVDGIRASSNASSLTEILAEDVDLILMKDISFTGTKQLPDRNNYVEVYGNKVGFAQYTGVLDGNGHTITDAEGDRSYVIVTHGGTIKNLTITTGARGIVTYSPSENVYIDNVVVDGAGYALNSTEQTAVDMFVTNSTINGWTSLAGFNKVVFENCKLGENSAKYWQSMGYDQDYDRLFRVYSPTSFTNCEFEQGYYLDMSAGGTATLTGCTVNGVVLTAENYAQYITIELPAGATLADCVSFN